MDNRVRKGIELLKRVDVDEISLAEAVTRIESVSSDPMVVRKTLDEAELRGVIDREDGVLQVEHRVDVCFEKDVVVKDGEFSCRRCGSSLSSGHFVKTGSEEIGPFGPSCIRKVLGKD